MPDFSLSPCLANTSTALASDSPKHNLYTFYSLGLRCFCSIMLHWPLHTFKHKDPPPDFSPSSTSLASPSSTPRSFVPAAGLIFGQYSVLYLTTILSSISLRNMIHLDHPPWIGCWLFSLCLGAQLIKKAFLVDPCSPKIERLLSNIGVS